VVLHDRKVEFHYQEVEAGPGAEAFPAWLERHKQKDRDRYFDLSKDPLIRVALFRVSHQHYFLVLSSHHIIMDGWCWGILVSDFLEAYACRQQRVTTATPSTRYKDYIEWVDQQDKKASEKYYRRFLSDYIPPSKSIFNVTQASGEDKHCHPFALSRETTAKLAALAAGMNTSLNVLIQSLWGIVVAKLNDARDVVFGTVVSGRPPSIRGIERMVGTFINTIPVRIRHAPGAKFSDLIRSTMQQWLESENHQFFPLADVLALSELREHLINHILVFQNFPKQKIQDGEPDAGAAEPSLGGFLHDSFSQNHYHFYVIVRPGDCLNVRLFYHPQAFDPAFVRALEAYTRNVIDQVLENPAVVVDDLYLEHPEQVMQDYRKLNATDWPVHDNPGVVALFTQQSKRNPHQLAIVADGGSFSYGMVNDLAEALAHHLLTQAGVQPEDRVGLFLAQDELVIVAMLAVAKAGCTFVPLDNQSPAGFIAHVAADARLALVLTSSGLADDLAGVVACPLLRIDQMMAGRSRPRNELPVTALPPHHPLYIIYTSGSTGRQKGVVVPQRSLTNYATSIRDRFLAGNACNGMLLSSYAFDLGYTSIWGSLVSGGCLHIPGERVAKDANKLMHYLRTRRVTFMKLTPSHFHLLMEAAHFDRLSSTDVSVVFFGGERIIYGDVKRLRELCPAVAVVNHYGPTETTVGSIAGPVTGENVHLYRHHSLLGRPLGNTRVYILNKGRLQPAGAEGDIYIGGEGVSSGYVNNPELTSEKFVPDPGVAGAVAYNTGDRGRVLFNGIEFLGRRDKEHKIRGYRVNLEYIEKRIAAVEGVQNCVAAVGTDGEGLPVLQGYVQSSTMRDAEDLRGKLAALLPEYMIPSLIVFLPAFPVTTNGKVDMAALQRTLAEGPGKDLIPPRNPTEKTLADIWAKVLDKHHLSVNDNFFSLGGHSLKAVQIISRVSKVMNVSLEVDDVFTLNTVEKLAQHIDRILWVSQPQTQDEDESKTGGVELLI
jgi:amino acid adenylation domain-containing protein